MGGLNWADLLDPKNGGPGEPPGRPQAVEAAAERTNSRYAKNGQKRAKGSKKRRARPLRGVVNP
jgi:hypothetical protein|tara:strand:+ start:61 stop:252 length:192 start_codon:yes stop_codon:yes gene_type:complete